MDEGFWAERWQQGQIGFHQHDVHQDLVTQAADWLAGGPKVVLVPLCGKSVDLPWLAAQGHSVIGVELIETAVEALFSTFGPGAAVAPLGPYRRWTHPAVPGLTVLQGDCLQLAAVRAQLPAIDRVWDRAALVALDAPRRALYAAALIEAAPGADVLLNVFDYGPDLSQGPPHSVQAAELDRLYPGRARRLVHERIEPASPGLQARGVGELRTQTWRLAL
jgi:thiopurine S-methyltransferase